MFDDDHLPREVVGRNSHMNEVTDALSPIEDGFRAENCFLFGPSGAGKTTVARASVRALRREVLDVPHAYVNCWQDYTRNAVLEILARDLVGTAVSRTSSTSELIKRVKMNLNSPGVVILDEVDQLEETEVLYDLHEIRGLSWIGIANDEIDLLAGLDDRVRSRVSVGYRVRFDSYSDDMIAEILERRARSGLGPNAAEADVFERIARLCDGDARTGIKTLRVSARFAMDEGLSTIPVRVVDDALPQAKREMARKTYSKLNQHQRVIYEILREEGPLIQRELYERYTRKHADPVTLRYLRDSHLLKLEHYDLIETEHRAGKKFYDLSIEHHEVHPEQV
ncbi:Cdc6/Cdc18 family protein [Halorubrum vacuolatum]|nr:Cdc6/Cdc18 family protein [Halorubrum vacuolatum]